MLPEREHKLRALECIELPLCLFMYYEQASIGLVWQDLIGIVFRPITFIVSAYAVCISDTVQPKPARRV